MGKFLKRGKRQSLLSKRALICGDIGGVSASDGDRKRKLRPPKRKVNFNLAHPEERRKQKHR